MFQSSDYIQHVQYKYLILFCSVSDQTDSLCSTRPEIVSPSFLSLIKTTKPILYLITICLILIENSTLKRISFQSTGTLRVTVKFEFSEYLLSFGLISLISELGQTPTNIGRTGGRNRGSKTFLGR